MNAAGFTPFQGPLPLPKDPRELQRVTRNTVLRDNFPITTWLAFGSLLQGVASLFLPARYALLPVATLLLYRTARTVLMHLGVIPNEQMEGVVMGRFSAQIPTREGAPPEKPSQEDIAVILLSTRTNHALGIFGPGYKDVSKYFSKMLGELWADKDKHGFLGHTSWLAGGDRDTNNQLMVVCYFRSIADVHKYAHGTLHRKAWLWWDSVTKAWPHLSIMHELYEAKAGSWENIYINNQLVGISNTSARMEVEGETVRPIFDLSSSRGAGRSSLGRLGRDAAGKTGAYGEESK